MVLAAASVTPVPMVSRSVLAQRFKSLCDAGVVERAGAEYRLTEGGQELGPIIVECGNWGARWARGKLKSDDVDVALLMWDVRRRIDRGSIPREPLLVQIDFRGAPRGKERFFLESGSTSSSFACRTRGATSTCD